MKQCIHNETVAVDHGSHGKSIGMPGIANHQMTSTFPSSLRTVPSTASRRPVGSLQQQAPVTLINPTSILALTKGTLGMKLTSTIAAPLISRNNEIFVDILKRLTVVMNSVGTVLNSQVDGCIQMKSYLANTTSALLSLALNEDIIIKNEIGSITCF